ncbi:hypothetical protein V7O61_06820 [Methanolobus sp. WCC1]|uniref:hypothetical protein n=1 Tax=unclassified Methanolobus TaxID=2629569 RepID=UPI00324B7364
MGIENRYRGFELASLEKELLFNRENIGFVKINKRTKSFFQLTASPFLENKKEEIFVPLNCPMPPDGKLIEVSVAKTEDQIFGKINNLSKIIIKYIDSWKEMDSSQFAKKSNLIRPQEFVDFFSKQYKSQFGMIEDIAECTALYALGSPQLFDEKGGLSASVIGKSGQWDGFYRSMAFIPRDFRKISSRNQYQMSKAEKPIHSNESIEISCAFHEPKETRVHVALPYEPEIRPERDEWYKNDVPLMRGFLINSLLIEPEIPDTLEKKVTDALYAIDWEYKKSKEVAYKQDLGSAIPRLCRSIARLERGDTVDNKNVNEIVDLWVDMHRKAQKIGATRSLNTKIADISVRGRVLFRKLEDVYGFDTFFDVKEAQKEITLSQIDFEDVFKELRINGYIYRSNKGLFKLIDI